MNRLDEERKMRIQEQGREEDGKEWSSWGNVMCSEPANEI